MSALHYLSATDAIGLYRSRQLSPVELVRALYDDMGVFDIAASFEHARGAWYVDAATSPAC